MKYSLFVGVVVCFALVVCACKDSEKPETTFFRDFNLGATVKQMNIAQLHPETGSSSVTNSIGETTERRREFNIEFVLDELTGEPFSEHIFLNELKSKIATQISNAGIQANSGNSGNDNFYFNYSTNENRGSVEVVGAKIEGNKYKLWCMIQESAGIESDK